MDFDVPGTEEGPNRRTPVKEPISDQFCSGTDEEYETTSKLASGQPKSVDHPEASPVSNEGFLRMEPHSLGSGSLGATVVVIVEAGSVIVEADSVTVTG